MFVLKIVERVHFNIDPIRESKGNIIHPKNLDFNRETLVPKRSLEDSFFKPASSTYARPTQPSMSFSLHGGTSGSVPGASQYYNVVDLNTKTFKCENTSLKPFQGLSPPKKEEKSISQITTVKSDSLSCYMFKNKEIKQNTSEYPLQEKPLNINVSKPSNIQPQKIEPKPLHIHEKEKRLQIVETRKRESDKVCKICSIFIERKSFRNSKKKEKGRSYHKMFFSRKYKESRAKFCSFKQ